MQLDRRHTNSVQQAAQQALELAQGRLYGLFNNAGYGQPGAVEDLSRDTLRKQFETNLFGLCELTNALLPSMFRQGRGRILQNSCVLAFAAMPVRGASDAGRFAVE